MQFFTFWRSLAAYRVRMVLNLKGISADAKQVDLMAGEQHTAAYTAVNPQGVLPALVLDDGVVLFQSMAIMEYLDETYPSPPLMPATTTAARARVRGLAQIAVADGHPLVTPRVRHYLEKSLSHDAGQIAAWSKHFMGAALTAMENELARSPATGRFCHGDALSLADVALVSQVVGYGYFGGTLDALPTVARIHQACSGIEAIASAHPLKQPGAPKQG